MLNFTKNTREDWFERALLLLQERHFEQVNLKLPPNIMIGCGMGGNRGKTLGQCWDTAVTSDNTTHIFICPTLSDPVEILGILMHELVHASIGVHHGHGKKFKESCARLGLKGKATCATACKGTRLYEDLEQLSQILGPYKHSPISRFRLSAYRKSSDKFLTLVSPSDSKYSIKVRTSVLEEFGPFYDHTGRELVVRTKR